MMESPPQVRSKRTAKVQFEVEETPGISDEDGDDEGSGGEPILPLKVVRKATPYPKKGQ